MESQLQKKAYLIERFFQNLTLKYVRTKASLPVLF